MNSILNIIYSVLFKDKPKKSYYIKNADTGEVTEVSKEHYDYVVNDLKQRKVQ